MKIVGYKFTSYTSKKTGKLVSGYNVYYTYKSTNEDLQGYAAESAWFSEDAFSELLDVTGGNVIGSEVDILYTRYGGIKGVRLLQA